MLPLGVMLYLTDYCTLECSHCYLVNKKRINTHILSYDKIISVLDELVKNNVFMVGVSGGEPLLHPQFFEIINAIQIRKMLPLAGITGRNLDNATALKLYTYGIRCIQVSLDGSDEKKNSYYRGTGAFDPILTSIKILQNNFINVNVAICLDANNYTDLLNILELCKNLYIYKVKVQFWSSFGCVIGKHQSLKEVQRAQVITDCSIFERQNGLENWIACQSTDNELIKIRHKNIVVDSNGDVLLFEGSEPMGNIYNDSLENIYTRYMDKL